MTIYIWYYKDISQLNDFPQGTKLSISSKAGNKTFFTSYIQRMKNYLCNYGSLREKSSLPIFCKCGEPCGSLKKLKLYMFEGCVNFRRSDSTNPSYRENTREKLHIGQGSCHWAIWYLYKTWLLAYIKISSVIFDE